MLCIVDHKSRSAKSITPASFGELAVRVRFDLQEWVLACPQLLGDELLVVTAEFDQFDKTSERLDILAVDRRGKLIVVELKRTAVGTKADLQALRYAAYCSTIGIDDVADLFAVYRQQRKLSDSQDSVEAKRQILEFIEEPEFEEFDDKPRIIRLLRSFHQR